MSNTKIHNITEDTGNNPQEDTNYTSNDACTYQVSRKNSVFDTIISHSAVRILLQSTMLVYNYGVNFTTHDPDQTIENFVNTSTKDGSIHKFGLSDIRKNALIELKNLAPNGKVHTFIDDHVSDIQIGITINHDLKHFAIVFRGSESIKDWYYDLQIYKHNLKDNIWIHSGFYNQLHTDNIHLCIIQKIKCILDSHPDFKIYVTGHSLGGALATLFGYMLSFEFDNLITVVSFASPRIGNKPWKKSFESKPNLVHFRVSNNRDLITATPTINYYHVGTDIQLFNDSFYINVGKTHSCFDYSLFTHWSILDHTCDNYYKNLINNVW